MTVRAVEGQKSYSGGIAIEITEDKVINLKLRGENNLIEYDEGDNEIYVDLQLDNEIEPTDTLPVGITTGRVVAANGWVKTGTIIVAKTTSGDNIKILYSDDGHVYMDNGTGTFKQIYFKGDVDLLINTLRTELQNYADSRPTFKAYPQEFDTTHTTQDFLDSISDLNLAVGNAYLGQVSLSDMPSGVTVQADVEVYIYPQNVVYCIMRSADVSPYIWECNSFQYRGWEAIGSGGGAGNVQAFPLSGTGSTTAVLEEAQAIYDYYLNGGTPIIVFRDTFDAFLFTVGRNHIDFCTQYGYSIIENNSYTKPSFQLIELDFDDDGEITEVKGDYNITWNGYLDISTNYSTPYTPQYDGSPATKKYVDDGLSTKQRAVAAGTNVEMYDAPVYEYITNSDMKGPCRNGFHIPLSTEWAAIYTVGTTLGIWDNSSSGSTAIKNYLKIPSAGCLAGNNEIYDRGNYAYLFASDEYYYDTHAYRPTIGPSSVDFSDYGQKKYGYSLREMKDTPEVPDGTWIALFHGIGDAGIFHNRTDGLISLSSDGTTRYTIADKNIGATVVYENGNTLSENNCGGYFQRGNNNMFPYSGSVTVSSTQVDASTYGPGNYYSSSTFIVSSVGNWDSPVNSNLRGGTSQGTYTQKTPTGETVYSIRAIPTISLTAPATPDEGMMWYDKTNGVLKIFDGTTRLTV